MRYWDGQQWTGLTHPRNPEPAAPVNVPEPRSGLRSARVDRDEPDPRQGKKRAGSWLGGAVVAALIGVGALWAAIGADDADSESTTPTTTPRQQYREARPAPYTLHESGDGHFYALVKTADTRQLMAAWHQIREEIVETRPDGGYFVTFDCAVGHDAGEAVNRLANAEVAVGRLGAEQTGLEAGADEFTMTAGARCGEDLGFHATFDRSAPLTEQSAVDVCRERIEDEFNTDQLPVALRGLEAVEVAEGQWTVTGTAQGAETYGPTAVIRFSCNAGTTDTGALLQDLPVFEVK